MWENKVAPRVPLSPGRGTAGVPCQQACDEAHVLDSAQCCAHALHAGADGAEGDKRSDPAPAAKPAPAAAQRSSLEMSRSAKFAAAEDTSGWGKARRASFSLPAAADV
jgi:hypothetical protein